MKKCNDTIRVRCDTLRHAISKHATAFNTTPYCTVSDDTMWFDYNSTGGDESALPCDTYKYGETAAWPDMPLIGPFRQGRKIQVSICFSFLKFSVDKIAIGLHLLETLADFFFCLTFHWFPVLWLLLHNLSSQVLTNAADQRLERANQANRNPSLKIACSAKERRGT